MLSLFVSEVGMEETQLAVALRPLLVMINCGGFDLSEHQSYKSIQRIYSTICFSLYTTVSNYIMYEKVKGLSEWDVELVVRLITSLSLSISFFLMNISLYILSWSGMKDLWKIVHQLEEMYNFDSRFYRTIRRQSWLAVIYTLTLVSYTIILY